MILLQSSMVHVMHRALVGGPRGLHGAGALAVGPLHVPRVSRNILSAGRASRAQGGRAQRHVTRGRARARARPCL